MTDHDRLIEAARKAKENSYSPYSKFRVGAALSLADGQVFSGTNIENASYGLTCCAERVAIFSARAASTEKITALAISIGEDDAGLEPESLVPCGACRQVMSEFMGADTPVIVDNNRTFKFGELLPHAFVLPEDR